MPQPSGAALPIDVFDIETEQTAQLDGVQLAYGLRGDRGSPVLLSMGFGVPGRAWVHQVPTLARRHRVAWYDQRGSGQSRAAPGRYSMPLLARDALGLLDHLGWREAHLVGVSMGGMVAQELALQHRERLLSLTLIATHAGGLRARIPRAAGVRRFMAAHLGSTEHRLDAVARLLFPADFLASCDRAWLHDVLRADFGAPPPPKLRLSQLRAIRSHDTRGRLGQLAGLPTLVIKPGADVLVRPSESDRLAQRIPGARLLELAQAGHGVIRQCYEEVNAALLEHFAAAERRRRP